MVAVRVHDHVRAPRGARARVLSAGALVALMVLAGCAPAESDDEPTAGFPTRTAAPVTAEPTAAAPALPAAGETVVFPEGVELPAPSPTEPPADEDFPLRGENSEAGAIDAAKYYWMLNTYARATGDTSDFEAMTLPECGFCANVNEVNVAVADGGMHAAADYPEISGQSVRNGDQGAYFVDFSVEYPPYYSVDPSTREVAGYQDGGQVSLKMVWVRSAWAVESGTLTRNGQ